MLLLLQQLQLQRLLLLLLLSVVAVMLWCACQAGFVLVSWLSGVRIRTSVEEL